MVSLRIKKLRKVGSNIGIYHHHHHQESPNDQQVMSCTDLSKRIPSWSQTGKRGRDNITTVDDNHKIYNVMPLSVYYGPEVFLTQQSRLDEQGMLITSKPKRAKKVISEEHHRCEVCGKTFLTGQALGGHKTSHRIQAKPVGVVELAERKVASGETGERRDFVNTLLSLPMQHPHYKQAKAVKSKEEEEHRCEICGQTFLTGQALGGHKTSHRAKPVAIELVARKLASASGETGEIRDYINTMPLPKDLHAKGDSSEDSYQQHPKKVLDFDLNIPYVE